MAPLGAVTYRDRVAVVTGAASGIGRALTQALAQGGAHVAASDIDERGLAETRAACPALTSPVKAARIILRGPGKNRARILVGPDGRAMAALPRVLGVRYADLVGRAARLTR